jgi:K+-transporting ATPase A subunit
MTSIRKLELGCGAATAFLGLILPFRVNGMHTFDLFRSFPSLLEDTLIFSICPGLVVALGAYMHAVMQKSWGRVLLWIAGIFYVILSPLVFLSDAYHAGWSKALPGLTPAALAIVTLVLSRKTFP